MSTTRVCDMGIGALHEALLKLDKAGFDADLMQKIATSKGNKIAKAMFVAAGGNQIDERFELLSQKLTIVVSAEYNHDTQLAKFAKQHRASCSYFNEALTDANFANVSDKLVAGRTYKVKQFLIKETVSSDDCLTLLRSQKALFVGAQGKSLVFDQNRNELVKGRAYVSFDKEANLPVVVGDRRVPYFHALSVGGFEVGLGRFALPWFGGRVLLCFCDETSGT